jgi:hypothetical protein
MERRELFTKVLQPFRTSEEDPVLSSEADDLNPWRKVCGLTAIVLVLTRCSRNAGNSPSSPTSPSPTRPEAIPSVRIEQARVGELKFSLTSSVDGSLYNAFLNMRTPAISTSNLRSVDTTTGRSFEGLAVVSVNGDRGPKFSDAQGRERFCGWVIGVGDYHGFYNSITDVRVSVGTRIDFYYGLPCFEPDRC